jgi:hypothetical protein
MSKRYLFILSLFVVTLGITIASITGCSKLVPDMNKAFAVQPILLKRKHYCFHRVTTSFLRIVLLLPA